MLEFATPFEFILFIICVYWCIEVLSLIFNSLFNFIYSHLFLKKDN